VNAGAQKSSVGKPAGSSNSSKFSYFRRSSSSAVGVPPMQVGQSSVRPPSGTVPGSNVPGGTAALGVIRLHVEPDRGEAMPGDEVTFAVSVRNDSAAPVSETQVILSFAPNQLIAVEANATIQTDHVQWVLPALGPQEKRVLVLRGQLRPEVQVGEFVRVNAIAIRNATVEPNTFTADIHVINRLPSTGFGDGTRPFEDMSRFLSPVSGGGAAVPAIVWASVVLVFLSMGMGVGKRYL
jgi:uncharacterized repeat protein (TIGR01451 family)